jgi:predicted nucleotidyltransferase
MVGMTSLPELESVVEALRKKMPLLAQRYHVDSLAVFGSFVRGEQHRDSDLDVLVSFSETPSLIEFIELEQRLSDELGLKVDLVMRDALKPSIGSRIRHELMSI